MFGCSAEDFAEHFIMSKNVIKTWWLTLFPKKYRITPDGKNLDWQTFENRINYRVKDRELFLEALRHRSHPSCAQPESLLSNERLEFLGDAVVNFCVGEFVYKKFNSAPEGDLTKMRSVLVSREFMAKKSRELGLGEFIAFGEGEERSGGRFKDSILSNTLESLIGAIYLDRGLEHVKAFLDFTVLSDYKNNLKTEGVNYKGNLLEFLQKNHKPVPKYVTKKETGPDHRRIYTVEVKVGREILGSGSGKSKKHAEQEAARHALEKINNNPS